ncbi:MAG: PH domain-containing protein [Nitrosopumilaceae archaeon]
MFGHKKEESELAFDISQFDSSEQDEINRIKIFLEAAEVIKAVARQSKFMPGGKLITPRTIFATNKRLILRDPNALGLRANLDSIPYSQINNIKLEKGAFTSEIRIKSGQFENDEQGFIPAIPKKKASKILGIINEYIRESQHFHGVIIPEEKKDDDPLTILKKRLAKGEIAKEEYNDLKSTLE